jgi:hypothetical protein
VPCGCCTCTTEPGCDPMSGCIHVDGGT